MRLCFRVDALFLLLALVGLSFADEVADLENIVSEFWTWRLRDDPEFATQSGIHDFDDKLRSYDYGQFQVRKEKCELLLGKLRRIDTSKLPSSSKLSFDVLEDNLMVFIDGFQWRNYGNLNPINFLEGIHMNMDYFVSHMDFKNKVDYDFYLKRLRALPTQVSQIISLMERAIQEGTTNHNVSILRVPSQIDSMINRSTEDLTAYKPFKDTLTNVTYINNTVKQELRNQAKTVLSTMVVPSFQNLSRFIRDQYIPKCRNTYGVGGLPRGQQYYKACLKWHLSTEMTPEEVHQKGHDEVKRLEEEMLKIARRNGFTGTTLAEFFGILRNDSRFYRNSSQELLDMYNEIIFQRIKPQLPKLFNDIPNYPLEVKPMEFDGPGGSYSPAAEDGSRPGIFWVNLLNPEKRATFDMASLSLHEADPGHHMQISYMIREKNPSFRKYLDLSKYFACPFHFPFFTAYIEGWALYAEDLGIEMGSYVDDYELFGKYSSEMFRACRLVVDTGLHAKGWSRDRAVNFMVEHTFDLRSQLEIEIDRYITWPGQACAYKIGQLKFQELRSKAKNNLGEAFDVAEFHDVVLRIGAVPLRILERRVDEWIQNKKVSTTTKPTSNALMTQPIYWTLMVALFCNLYTTYF